MNALLHTFALIGITLIVVRSTIFAPIRRIRLPLLQCTQCAGTWVGVVAGASGIVTAGHGRFLDAVIVGAATSFASMLADAILLNLLGDPSESNSQTKP
jgi:hypothetical protein